MKSDTQQGVIAGKDTQFILRIYKFKNAFFKESDIKVFYYWNKIACY